MYITQLLRKPGKGQPMLPVEQLTFIAGSGIEGDANADPLSPRQVLLTRQEETDQLGIHPGDLRENIVLTGVQDNEWQPGAALHFSSEVVLRLTFHCEPCMRLAHLGIPLKELIGLRGILARVERGGMLHVGDTVTVQPHAFPAYSEKAIERFMAYVGTIPSGTVVTYRDVVRSIGVAESYMRAIPQYIKQFDGVLPVHRIVDTEGKPIPYAAQQQERLAAEGYYFVTS